MSIVLFSVESINFRDSRGFRSLIIALGCLVIGGIVLCLVLILSLYVLEPESLFLLILTVCLITAPKKYSQRTRQSRPYKYMGRVVLMPSSTAVDDV